MAAKNKKVRKIIIEARNPGWRTIPDIFAWFDNGNDNVFVYSEKIRLPHWPRPATFHTLGMPSDLPLVEIVGSGSMHDKKFKDYLTCFAGVLADKQNPTKGQTNSHHNWHFPNGRTATIHHWGVLLIARDVETKLISLWNVGQQPFFPPLPTTEDPGNGWWQFFLNLNVQRPEDIKKLADGFVLLHSQGKQNVSERTPRMSEEEFLILGEAAAEALAREGKPNLYMKDVARQMKKDRETVKVLRKTYPNVWPKLVRKFADTHTWLNAHKRS